MRSLCDPETEDLLFRQGFCPVEGADCLYQVDMHAPTVLIQNLETAIQEPLSQNSRVLSAIRQSHERLQLALASLLLRQRRLWRLGIRQSVR